MDPYPREQIGGWFVPLDVGTVLMKPRTPAEREFRVSDGKE